MTRVNILRRGAKKYVYVHGHDEQRFDPDAIAAAGADSVRRRELIARALARNETRWDYQPVFDATKQYVR